MKILLIQPPVKDFYFTAKRSVPYGLISIAASLRKADFDVELIDALSTSKSKIIDMPREMAYLKNLFPSEDISPFSLFHHYRYYGYSLEHLGNLISKSGANLVGVSSLFTAYSDEAYEIANLVKEKLPNSQIVFGGHHPTAMPEKVMVNPVIDYIIRGEGEIAFVQLALALINKEPIDTIKGLVYRDKYGVVQLNPITFIDNLDDLPLPAMDLVNNKFYGRKSGGSTVVLGSRGCPMKCSYCCVASPNSKYRKRSVESVFSEIKKSIDDYGVRFIDFEDENLTLDKEWFYCLLNKLKINYSHINLELRAMNGLYPPTLDEKMLVEMKEAGFKVINLSLCTTSQKQLKRFKRADVRESVEKLVITAKQCGMDVVCYIIAGTPGQNAHETIQDLIYLYQLDVVAGVSIFYPAPGSLEFERTKAKGLLPETLGLMRSSVIPISDTTSRLESVTLLRLGRILNFIKKLRDEGKLVKASPFDKQQSENLNDRNGVGHYLVEAFLYDGNIRGVRQDGTIFCHETSIELTKMFIQGIGF